MLPKDFELLKAAFSQINDRQLIYYTLGKKAYQGQFDKKIKMKKEIWFHI